MKKNNNLIKLLIFIFILIITIIKTYASSSDLTIKCDKETTFKLYKIATIENNNTIIDDRYKSYSLDFSDVKETKLVAEGEQSLTIIGAKEARSANGTAMLVIDMNNEEGGFVRDNICLEGPGAFRAQQFIKALDIPEDVFASMEASDLIGMNPKAIIEHEEYNGEERAKVKKYVA